MTARRAGSAARSAAAGRAASSRMPSPVRSRSPELGEHRARELRVGLSERKIGIEPRHVGRAHRARHRIARAVEHLLAVLAAIDRRRNREPERFAPSATADRRISTGGVLRKALVRRSARREGGKPQRIGVEARSQLEQPRLAALLELLQRFDVFRANRAVCEVVLPACAGAGARTISSRYGRGEPLAALRQ